MTNPGPPDPPVPDRPGPRRPGPSQPGPSQPGLGPAGSGQQGSGPAAGSAAVPALGRVRPPARPANQGTVLAPAAEEPTTGAIITTTAAAAAAAGAAAAAAVAAPPGPPPSPPGYTPDQSPEPPSPAPSWRPRRHRLLARLRIGQHAAPFDVLDQVPLAIGSVGLKLGHGQAGEPVTIRLFGPEPTHVALVGNAWLADLIAFRALRFGARLVVFTHHPAGWIDLGKRAAGRTDRVAVLVPGSEVSMPAAADIPVLRLAGSGQPAGPDLNLPAWTTWLSVLPPATMTDLAIRPDRTAQLANADVVLTQQLAPPAASVLASVRGLPQQVHGALPTLPNDVVAVLTRTVVRYARLNPTSVEREVLAQPAQL